MSADEIINALPGLSGSERRLVLKKLCELSEQDKDVPLKEETTSYEVVNLRDRGVGEAQAGELRARLRTFAEDWERPEASIYDEDPAR